MQAEGRLRGMEKRAMTIVFRACVVMTVFVVSAVAINAQTLNNGGFEIGGGPYTNPATSLISTAAVSWVQFATGYMADIAALARLAYTKAYLLWGAINVLLWIVFQHVLRPYAQRPQHPYHYFFLCSLFFPLWAALIQGQTSVLLLALFALTFAYARRGEDFKAGVFLGLGLFKYALVIPFALICLLRGKWRMMAGFAAAAFALGALSVIAVGPAGVQSYVKLMLDILSHPENPLYADIKPLGMPTVTGFFAALFTGRLALVYNNALGTTVSALLVLFTALRWRQDDLGANGNNSGLMFAAALAASQVTAPYLYTHDMTLMLTPTLLVLGSSQWSRASTERRVLLAVILILYTPPLYVAILRWHMMYLLAPALVIFALAAVSMATKPADELAAGT